MLSRIHPIAGTVGLITILAFWTSTVVAEIGGSRHVITVVKQTIPWCLPILVLALVATGSSGLRLAAGSTFPIVLAKKRRMPFIAGNGLLILIPSAITLSILAGHDDFGTAFYCVQTLELVAGAVNIALMSLNIRDGLRLSGRFGVGRERPTATNPSVAVSSEEPRRQV
ncbi:hypothetical protein ACFYTQ_04680 [Nocardia sp. NPDC004068]|uniref:hypothetical protein n=1 Tax=Nocardia sp. NPDC004068 TaxID=3364303 RepID=UPI0036999653